MAKTAATVRRESAVRRARHQEATVDASWFPDWTGETVVIVAGGASAADVDLTKARGKSRLIVINESWRLCPWADALYACDAAWWRLRKGVPEFVGLKVSQSSLVCRCYSDVRRIVVRLGCGEILTEPAGVVGCGARMTGGNGGFQALSLAIQWGIKRAILVGFDMGGEHWHGAHADGLNNPHERLFEEWTRMLDGAAGRLRDLGIEVLNCSPVSKLKAYPKVTLDDALRHV